MEMKDDEKRLFSSPKRNIDTFIFATLLISVSPAYRRD